MWCDKDKIKIRMASIINNAFIDILLISVMGLLTLIVSACSGCCSYEKTERETYQSYIADSNSNCIYSSINNAPSSISGKEEYKTIYIDSIVYEKKLYLDCEECSHPIVRVSIPVSKCVNEEKSAFADSINKHIESLLSLDFRIKECSEDDLDQWVGVDCEGMRFDYMYYSHYLYLDMEIQYKGAHIEPPVNEKTIIDLTNGVLVENKHIPFFYLFTEQGYSELLEKCNWKESMKSTFRYSYDLMWNADDPEYIELSDSEKEEKMKEVDKKAEEEMHNIEYHIEDSTLVFYCYSQLFGWALRCYNPYVDDRIKFEDVRPFLSEIGEKYLFDRDSTRTPIEWQLWENDLYNQIKK